MGLEDAESTFVVLQELAQHEVGCDLKRGVERAGLYAGWGVERALGPSFTMLAARYVRLMVVPPKVSGLRSVHMLPSLVLTLSSMVLIVRLVMELVSSV